MQFHMILCQKHHETARFLRVFLMTHRESLQMRALYSCCMAGYPFLHPASYHTKQGAKVRKNGAIGVGLFPGREESYTLSYTGKVLLLLMFSLPGVGNVVFFQKLFLRREG